MVFEAEPTVRLTVFAMFIFLAWSVENEGHSNDVYDLSELLEAK